MWSSRGSSSVASTTRRRWRCCRATVSASQSNYATFRLLIPFSLSCRLLWRRIVSAQAGRTTRAEATTHHTQHTAATRLQGLLRGVPQTVPQSAREPGQGYGPESENSAGKGDDKMTLPTQAYISTFPPGLVPEPARQGQENPEESQAGAARQGSQRCALAGLTGVTGQQPDHQDQRRSAQ